MIGGNASNFIINVDGLPGRSFTDIVIAAHDSMYIFIQVNVNPGNPNIPFIISDGIQFTTNGNVQTVYLEAWGQNAYYHRPTDAIKFKDGTYFPFSIISSTKNVDTTWTNDKPHVIYGYLVVDSGQKLTIPAGVHIYMNYKAGLWVFQGGQIQIKGTKGNEVTFQGARREKDLADEPGQWDRIWINEGSENNLINYAIIKNGYIGVQAENLGSSLGIDPTATRRLKITNTKIQNMSLWGLYGLNYNVYGGNNVISNCQEYSVNLQLGGKYTFIHCTFANYWNKDKARDKPTININNYSAASTFSLDTCYFGNCIVDGKLGNELGIDLKPTPTPSVVFSNCWLKTTIDVNAEPNRYFNCMKWNGSDLDYEDPGNYYFKTKPSQAAVKNFVSTQATSNAILFPTDIEGAVRNQVSVTVGAYWVN